MSTQKKQVTVIVALVIVFALLAWQIFKLVGSDVGRRAVASKAAMKTLKQPKRNAPKQAKWQQVVAATPAEKQYLQLAADIQKAKMHHQLLQQQVAIAEAEKKLALSHKQTINLSSTGVEEFNAWSNPTSIASEDFHLIYLAKVSSGHWQATLQRGSELVHVGRGSSLGNGRRVAAIINRGLWVQDGSGISWLGFPGEAAPSGAAASAVNFPAKKNE